MRWLSKLVIIWEKTKRLVLTELERAYIEQEYANILSKDIEGLRAELGKLNAIKDPKTETKVKISELDAEVTEIMQYKNMVERSVSNEIDLREQIKMFKKSLWK